MVRTLKKQQKEQNCLTQQDCQFEKEEENKDSEREKKYILPCINVYKLLVLGGLMFCEFEKRPELSIPRGV